MVAVSFNKALETACHNAGIVGSELGAIFTEISGHIALDEVSDYYIVAGPFPAFPRLKLDVFLLTEEFVYNYAVADSNDEEWTIVPLTSIVSFEESGTPDALFWSLTMYRQLPSSLVIMDRIENRYKVREFTNRCLSNLAAIIKSAN